MQNYLCAVQTSYSFFPCCASNTLLNLLSPFPAASTAFQRKARFVPPSQLARSCWKHQRQPLAVPCLWGAGLRGSSLAELSCELTCGTMLRAIYLLGAVTHRSVATNCSGTAPCCPPCHLSYSLVQL